MCCCRKTNSRSAAADPRRRSCPARPPGRNCTVLTWVGWIAAACWNSLSNIGAWPPGRRATTTDPATDGIAMKLLRYGNSGHEKPGVLDAEGVVRDLSAHVADFTPDQLSPANLARLRAIDPRTLPAVKRPVRYPAPVSCASKLVAIGLNHAG